MTYAPAFFNIRVNTYQKIIFTFLHIFTFCEMKFSHYYQTTF